VDGLNLAGADRQLEDRQSKEADVRSAGCEVRKDAQADTEKHFAAARNRPLVDCSAALIGREQTGSFRSDKTRMQTALEPRTLAHLSLQPVAATTYEVNGREWLGKLNSRLKAYAPCISSDVQSMIEARDLAKQ